MDASPWQPRHSACAWSLPAETASSAATAAAKNPLRRNVFVWPAPQRGGDTIENPLDSAASPILPSSFSEREDLGPLFPACLLRTPALLRKKGLLLLGSYLRGDTFEEKLAVIRITKPKTKELHFCFQLGIDSITLNRATVLFLADCA
jgi:hypothetical protein